VRSGKRRRWPLQSKRTRRCLWQTISSRRYRRPTVSRFASSEFSVHLTVQTERFFCFQPFSDLGFSQHVLASCTWP
jgi:hypothetical protein